MKEALIIQRLRAARLRPTIARVCILQIIESAGSGRICAENIFREVLRRGTHASMGTVYRGLQQLETGGLLVREWDNNRKALYRFKPEECDGTQMVLVCRASGQTVVLTDPELHASLLLATEREGMNLAGQAIRIEVDRIKYQESAPRTSSVVALTSAPVPVRAR